MNFTAFKTDWLPDVLGVQITDSIEIFPFYLGIRTTDLKVTGIEKETKNVKHFREGNELVHKTI